MNSIINFLKDNSVLQINDEQANVARQDIDKINLLFVNQKITLRKNSQTHILPKVNQIWSVKTEYFDFLGKKQNTLHPFLVSLLTDIDEYEEEKFVRVAVISPFTELASKQDELCNDLSIVGFPFLVEAWNDQPVLTEILDEYLGYFEPKDVAYRKENLSKNQQQFRETEISRAVFLNNSISALVGFVEMNQNNEFGAVISVNGQVFFGSPQEEKQKDKTKDKEEQTIELPSNMYRLLSNAKSKVITFGKNDKLPFEIQIKKSEDGFIISVFTREVLTLSDSDNKNKTPFSNSERYVFSALKKGLYTLTLNNIHEPIKIRLK